MATCRGTGFAAVVGILMLTGAGVRAGTLPDGVELVEDGPGRIVLEVRSPEPVWRAGLPAGSFPALPGFGLIFAEGRPVLPRRLLRLAVPAGARLSVRTEILEDVDLPGGAVAAPHVDHQTDLEHPAGAGRTILRPVTTDAALRYPFPAAVASLAGTGRLRDLPVARLELTPIRVVNRAGALRLARRYRVEITWSETGTAGAAPRRARPDERLESIYRRAVVNPAGARRHRLAPAQRAAPGPVAAAGTGTAAVPLGSASTGLAATTTALALRPAVTLTPLAGSTVYRLSVAEEGMIRLDAAWIAANAPDLLTHPTSDLFVQANGVEIPVRMVDGGDGVFSPGDYMEFWGEKVDEDPLDPDAWQGGDFTDVRPYFIGAASGVRARMPETVSGAPVSGSPVLSTFTRTLTIDNDTAFLNTVPSDAAGRWYDQFLLSPTPASNPPRPDTTLVDYVLALPGLVTTGNASLRVRLLGDTIGGNTNGLHRTRLIVDGVVEDVADWDGLAIYTQGVDGGPVTFPASDLAASATLRIDVPLGRLDGGVPVTADLVWIDAIDLDYPHDFVAENDRLLFEVPNVASQIVVTGLTAPDAAAYDITPSAGGLAAPWHLAGAVLSGTGPFALTFEIDPAELPGATRRLVVTAGNALVPAAGDVAVHTPGQDLSAGGADWLLIGNGALLDETPTSSLSDLIALRQAQGLTPRVVTAREAYDQFAYGLEDPQAIRDLIHWALLNWSPAPSFVVLVGDGTLDYKNDFGHPVSRNLLPTYMSSQVASPDLTYFSEDNRFAAVLGADDLPDVLLGRLPTHSLAETEAMFAKIVGYEALSPGAPWTRRTFFISDAESGGFESTERFAIDTYFDRPENPGVLDPTGPCFSSGTCRNDPAGMGPIFDTASFQALLNRNPTMNAGQLASTMNQWIRDGIDAGASTTEFIGHGGFLTWGRDATIYRSRSVAPDDIDALTNAGLLTFLVNINCITGGFHTDSKAGASTDQQYSLAEDFLVSTPRAGIGALAPSHLTFISILSPVSNALWDALLGENPRERLLGGLNLVLRLKLDEIGAESDVRSYAFLGDPATRLILPDPAAPGVPAVTSGNAGVDLNWSPGDGVTFFVQRAVGGPAGPYAVVSPAGTTATSFSDTSVKNGTTYWYRIVGRDGNGMDSTPSNLNQDCPAGPGCAMATPLNPDPPVTPSGFTAADPGTGGTVAMTWAANPENDIDFYRVRYGASPGVYPSIATFGRTSVGGKLTGLTDGEPVFAVLEAVNTSGLTSPAAGPVSATPHLINGISPPAPILDLRVTRDTDDAVLTWSPVGLDIYDRPAAVAQYRVYSSGASPLFPVDGGHLLGTVADGPAPSYRHLGAAISPETRFYLVLTRDADGFDSASGLSLPASVGDLRMSRVAGGLLRLTWSPVTTDRAGQPLAIDHYVVYASPQAFGRSDTPTLVPVASFVDATTLDLVEGADAFFSVLAVDARGNVSPF
ncbi:MAG: C25 family cysteine peptidase [Acidobacteriota bacterium]